MVVLIAAGGTNERWGVPGAKVLAEADGEPLVGRTLRMVRERGVEPFVLSSIAEVGAFVGRAWYPVPPTPSVCETLLAARELWGASAGALLLGDVWYTDSALRAAMGYRGALVRAWGNHQEVFALAWHADLARLVARCTTDALPHGGKLWHALRLMDGLPPRSHARLPAMLTWVTDGTRDFDHAQDLDRWHKERWR